MAAWMSISITPWQPFTLKMTSQHMCTSSSGQCTSVWLWKNTWHLPKTSVANNTKVRQISYGSKRHLFTWYVLSFKKEWKTMEIILQLIQNQKVKKAHYKSVLSVSLEIPANPLLHCFFLWYNHIKCPSQIRHNDLMLKTFQNVVRLFTYSLTMASSVGETLAQLSAVTPNFT